MSDDIKQDATPEPQEPENKPAASDATENTDEPGRIPYERFKAVNEKAKKLEARLAEIERLERERKEKEAIEQGNYLSVIEELKPKAQRVESLESVVAKLLEQELKSVPEEYHDLIPEADIVTQLDWITNAKERGLFTPRRAPEMDAGVTGERQEQIEITEADRKAAELAQRGGYKITPEDVARRRLARSGRNP